jgi:hypothetical protein
LIFTRNLIALLRAIAAKIIPGMPFSTKIAILQQTAADDDDSTVAPEEALQKTPLQYIIESDMSRNEIQAELNSKWTWLPLVPSFPGVHR